MQASGANPTADSTASQLDEQRSLALGLWVSLAIALMGLLAYGLSGSEAVLLDGLYAGVMALTSLVTARIGANVSRPPDRGWPFGYEGQEAVYVLLRSLLLLGILSFAALNAGRELLAWWQGDTPKPIATGPAGWYGLLGGLSCGALAWAQHRSWVAGGRCSELLRTESRAARLDTAITGGTGAVLVAAPLLNGTALAPLEPVADALLVLVLSLVVAGEPLHRFRQALRETAGAACDPELIHRTRAAAAGLVEAAAAQLLDLSVVKLGRISTVVAYVNPGRAVEASWLDRLRGQLDAGCGALLGPVRAEVVLTGRMPFDRGTSGAGRRLTGEPTGF
jgi:predicted Co/Zn/Cd cation transporter (cation efflux family)